MRDSPKGPIEPWLLHPGQCDIIEYFDSQNIPNVFTWNFNLHAIEIDQTVTLQKKNNFRHYLDFIQQMVKLYAEKRADLEEQQLHLNVGLGKIAETVEQVEEMQKSLAVKSQVLKHLNVTCIRQIRRRRIWESNRSSLKASPMLCGFVGYV